MAKDTHLEQPVPQVSPWKHTEWAAIQPAITYENQASVEGAGPAVDRDFRRGAQQGVASRQHIGQWAHELFGAPVYELYSARIQARPRQLREIAPLVFAVSQILNVRQINALLLPAKDCFPRRLDGRGQAQFSRENVYGAERQDAKPHLLESVGRIAQTIQHLVHRSVTSGCDYNLKPLADTFGSKLAGVS